MSRTEMYAAPEGGKFEQIAELPNSWGSASRIWSAISERYFGDKMHWLIRCGRDDETAKAFWAFHADPRLTLTEKIVFQSTFDCALVKRDRFRELAKAFREFDRMYPAPTGTANHLPTMAEILDRLASDAHGLDFTPFSVGWRQTTVSPCHWWVRPENENEDFDDDGRPYDLSIDTDHFFLFEE